MEKSILLHGRWKNGNPNPEWCLDEPCYELYSTDYPYQELFPKTDIYRLATWEKGLFMFGNKHVCVTVAKAERMALALAKAWFRKNYC